VPRVSPVRTARLAVLAVVAAAALPAQAVACDHGQQARAAKQAGQRGRAPLAVGDSTMYFSVPDLAARGIEADAKGCRIFYTGVELLAARLKAGTLPRLSILALGANGEVADGNVEFALETIGPRRVLGVVTSPNTPENAKVLRAAAVRHPAQIIVMDWARYSAGHPSWFAGDGLHMGHTGLREFAAFIRRRADPMMPPSAARLGLPGSKAGAKACGQLAATSVFIVRGAGRITCGGARSLARRSPLVPWAGWRPYAWKAAGGSVWSAVYRRADGKVLVATRAAPAT
jgi:hypothetical protein